MNTRLKNILIDLNATDMINMVFFTLLTVFMLLYSARIDLWPFFVVLNLIILLVIPTLARFASNRGQIWNLLHGFYMMLCIPIAFKQMYFLVPAIHPTDYDQFLIAIDYSVFGVHPTQWLSQFQHPLLTEILQIAYASFYLLPLILAIDYYRKKRTLAFKRVFGTVILGFYLSYIGYVAVPAIGPRFTLHDFGSIDNDLPGLLLTNALRVYTNTGESIPPGTEHPARDVQRDVFPSGHSQVTLLVIFLAFRYRARTRWFLGITGSLLIIATVYLRYHYVVDLAAAAVWAGLTLWLSEFLDSMWTGLRARLTNEKAISNK